MIFKPANSKFLSYSTNNSAPTELSPLLFQKIIISRSRLLDEGHIPFGGDKVNQYYISQIDMADPDAFTLCMAEFKKWHTLIPELL